MFGVTNGIAYLLANSGGSSTSDGQQTGCQEQSSVGTSRRSATEPIDGASFGNGKGNKAMGAKRRKATSRTSSQGGGTDAVEADVSLKVLGGGQPLVDDFDVDNFEARKVGHEFDCGWSAQLVDSGSKVFFPGVIQFTITR